MMMMVMMMMKILQLFFEFDDGDRINHSKKLFKSYLNDDSNWISENMSPVTAL